ncbi:hypothetical protein ACP3V3_02505 [Vibrio sp. PNB22_3_1]
MDSISKLLTVFEATQSFISTCVEKKTVALPTTTREELLNKIKATGKASGSQQSLAYALISGSCFFFYEAVGELLSYHKIERTDLAGFNENGDAVHFFVSVEIDGISYFIDGAGIYLQVSEIVDRYSSKVTEIIEIDPNNHAELIELWNASTIDIIDACDSDQLFDPDDEDYRCILDGEIIHYTEVYERFGMTLAQDHILGFS